MKTVSLCLEIGILAQIGVLIRIKCLYNDPTWNYTQLSSCVCACAKCTVHGYVSLCIKILSNGTKGLTLKYFVVKKCSSDTLGDENILPRIIFTQNYPTVNFPKLQYIRIYKSITYIYTCYMMRSKQLVHSFCRLELS